MERCECWLFHRHFEITSAEAFFQGIKATFPTKNCCQKRQDNAGKDKIIHLFLETRKSAVKFQVDAIT